ncbi:unnamed protein product [Spodoptera exigua]|nr:unnamed protein product [Spodoptera exigua]
MIPKREPRKRSAHILFEEHEWSSEQRPLWVDNVTHMKVKTPLRIAPADRLARRTTIIDVAIPHDENLVKAEKDKQLKYLDLAHEVVDMWSVDSAIIVPIVVLANGLVPKSLDNQLKRLTLGGWIKGLIQKAVLLETARIVRRFLSLEP